MDHVSLDTTRRQPARQPEAVAAGFETCPWLEQGASAIRVIVRPALTASSRQAMQRAKQPFWARLQLLARLTLNAGKHAGNQPARLAQLDDGNDRVILVQGDEGLAQSLPWRKPGSFGWGTRHSIG